MTDAFVRAGRGQVWESLLNPTTAVFQMLTEKATDGQLAGSTQVKNGAIVLVPERWRRVSMRLSVVAALRGNGR